MRLKYVDCQRNDCAGRGMNQWCGSDERPEDLGNVIQETTIITDKPLESLQLLDLGR
jgi:hypothetical protein